MDNEIMNTEAINSHEWVINCQETRNSILKIFDAMMDVLDGNIARHNNTHLIGTAECSVFLLNLPQPYTMKMALHREILRLPSSLYNEIEKFADEYVMFYINEEGFKYPENDTEEVELGELLSDFLEENQIDPKEVIQSIEEECSLPRKYMELFSEYLHKELTHRFKDLVRAYF